MSNPLKKTMVFLGLAEEEFDETLQENTAVVKKQEERPTTPSKAQVTPLRRVMPAAGDSTAMNEILTVHPAEYRDAQTVGESFREGIPVIINLSRMTDADAKRMIDFSSGLAMGLGGRIERVTNKVFLLSPEHILVTGDEPEQQIESESGSFFVAQ
ncbi:MAG TPA: cell division protein SepF [Microbacteriaceae bacterium]|nr:cell division protein SepF [Microbacteriaceae bacterium]